MRPDHPDAIGGRQLAQPRDTKYRGGVEARDALEVEYQVAQLLPGCIPKTRPHFLQNALDCAEEDKALQSQDVDLLTMLREQIAMRLRTIHVAVEDLPIQHVADNIHAAICDHKEDGGNEHACGNALEEAEGHNDPEDEPYEEIIGGRQEFPRVDQPLHQEPEPEIQQQPAEHHLRDVGDE